MTATTNTVPYWRLCRRAKPLGWRVSVSGATFRIRDAQGQELHAGSLATAWAFVTAQPRPPYKYPSKQAPEAWAQPIEDYLLSLAAAGYRESTLKVRRDHLATMARGLACPPEAVTGDALVTWFGAQRWKPETRKGYRSSARGFFTWAYRTGRVPAYISDEIPKPRPPHGVPRPVPDEALRAALATADARTTLMLRLAAEAGLRRAEVARVHTRDLIDGVGGAQLLVHGKGGKQRMVPIGDHLAALIRRGAVGHTPQPAALGQSAEGWLFPGTDNGHLTPEWVGILVSCVLPEGYTMHTLRHFYASRVYRGSRNLRAVQQLLGHSSIATTERYCAVDSDEIRAAAACAW